MIFSLTAFAQKGRKQLLLQNSVDKALNQMLGNSQIDADSAYRLIGSWSGYPDIQQTGYDYIYYYEDAVFGKVPMHVYIPPTYKNTQKTPCVMLLHGATGGSHFKDIDSTDATDDDILFDALKATNYIVIRPLADRDKNFNWVVSQQSFGEANGINPTFRTLDDILTSLKKVLNIDDSKVFAMGHSDGSDGASGLAVYAPNAFAGIVAYNSMLNVLFAKDYFIRNIQNRRAYIVHSSLDNLRPIEITRILVDSLSKFGDNILYKEYIGYQHYDKHLDMDLPRACEFMRGVSRDPFRKSLYWETSNNDIYNNCDWLSITGINTNLPPAVWYHPFNVSVVSKQLKIADQPYYRSLNKSAIVKANYNNNVFTIQTSRVTAIELLISPVMVNLGNDIVVIINGKEAYKSKVKADKNFMLISFKHTMDRNALWVNSIKLKVE